MSNPRSLAQPFRIFRLPIRSYIRSQRQPETTPTHIFRLPFAISFKIAPFLLIQKTSCPNL
nr:hypothetical protein [uncultured Kingella sp.]